MARIGVFGGTFDPVHMGHLVLAEQCREQGRLDEVRFVPAARPPHKPGVVLTPFERRVEMLELAIAGQPAFRVDELEKQRTGPSYTADTLGELHERQPDADLFFLLGSDCLPDLVHWRRPQRIVELAVLLIWERPGWPVWPIEQLGGALSLPAGTVIRHQVCRGPLVDIASRDLRARVADGRSIRFLVPRSVECYIEAHRLYR